MIQWIAFVGFSGMSIYIPLYSGVRTLIARGKPVSQREADPQLLAFERTSTPVTTGIYRYIRHPLCSSLLLLAWGLFFKAPTGSVAS